MQFPYVWYLGDGFPARGIPYHGKKVFGTFLCGGGSSMGYKLAGYNHLGGVEIDPVISEIYRGNLSPKYLYVEDIRDFINRTDLPQELYDLDILDGSPPCTTFSMCGKRETTWGVKKKFREGQKEQRLDDLVMVYCDLIAKLLPKVCIFENVAGLAKGNAKLYLQGVCRKLASNYRTQIFLLDGQYMGVPQRRKRCFVIGLRNDFNLPSLSIYFHQRPILFCEIRDDKYYKQQPLTEFAFKYWKNKQPQDKKLSDVIFRMEHRLSCFNQIFVFDDKVVPTLTASTMLPLYSSARYLNEKEIRTVATFPQDYKNGNKICYGMCVPPVMMAQISFQIYKQWLSKM